MQWRMTGRKGFLALYRCEKCGKVNIGPITLTMQHTYDDAAWTSTGRANQRSLNAMKLRQKMDAIFTDLLDGENAKVFPKAQLKCACSQCKARAPWARLSYTWVKIGMGLLGFGCFFLLLAAFGRDLLGLDHISYRVARQCQQFVPLALGVLSACASAWAIHFAVMMSRIKKSMNICPPIFSRSMDMLRKKAEKYEAYSDIDWSGYDAEGK